MKKFVLNLMLLLCAGSVSAVAAAPANTAQEKKAEAMKQARQRLAEGKGMSLDLPAGLMPSRSNKNFKGRNLLGSGKTVSSVNQLSRPRNPMAAKREAPNRLNWTGLDLYAYINYEYTYDFVPGMFKLEEDGYEFMWIDSVWSDLEEGQTQNGWYKDGQYQGLQCLYIPGVIWAYFWYSMDFETGELLEFEDYYGQTNFAFIQCTYNPEDNRIYGIGHDFTNTESRLFWASCPIDDFDNVTLIAPVNDEVTDNPEENNMAYALCYNPADGYFYAITVWGDLVRIHEDGTQEPVLTLHYPYYNLTYPTGLVYSPVTNCFIWAPYYGDDSTGLALLDPATGLEEQVEYYDLGPQMSTLISLAPFEAKPDQPLRAEISSINFPNGAMTGTVDFTMPTKLASGNTIPAGAVLSYTALLDGEVVATGKAETGAVVTVDYTVKGTGYHTIGIYTTYNDDQSYTADKKAWIGNDRPFPPSNVVMTETLVSWDPVGNVGTHGGYVNPAEVTYSIWINNEYIGSTKENSFPVSLSSEQLKAFFASVFAEFDGVSSKAGRSNRVITGEAYTVPMFLQPTEEEFNLMTIYDANGDDETWFYYPERDCVATDYSMSEDMDDYIFLPAINITDTQYLYEFSLDAVVSDNAADYIEYIEVVWATEPDEDNLGGYIIDEFFPEGNVYKKDWTHKSGLWAVDSPGIYYIGLHCTSPANQIGVFARNFNLVQSKVTRDAPAAPVIRRIKSGTQGSLDAEVTVALPSKDYVGNALASNLEMTVHFYVNGEPVTATVTGLPGEEVTAMVPTRQGDNTVMAYITAGELQSPLSDPYVIFTGQTVPAATKSVTFTVAENMLSSTLSWEPVTEADVPTGYVDPEDITYTVYIAKTQGEDPVWSVYRENVAETTIEYTLPEYSEMALYMFGIETFSPEGSNGEIVSSNSDQMGKPYTLPYVETFDDPDQGFVTLPWLAYEYYNGKYIFGNWVLTDLDELMEGTNYENEPGLFGFSLYSNDYGLISMPRFSTIGVEHAMISFSTVYAYYMANLKLMARVYGSDEYVEIGSVDEYNEDEEYVDRVSFYLPDSLMGQDWVEINFLGEYDYGYTFTTVLNVEVIATEEGSVASLSNAGRIIGGKGEINVNGLEGANVSIVTLDGKKVVNTVANSDKASYNVAPGIYLVSAGSKRAKVIVK